jgi:hypothetical protein
MSIRSSNNISEINIIMKSLLIYCAIVILSLGKSDSAEISSPLVSGSSMNRVNEFIKGELASVDLDASSENKVELLECFSGALGMEFMYLYYPKVELLKIIPAHNDVNPTSLYIKVSLPKPERTLGEGGKESWALGAQLKELILLCASGITRVDLRSGRYHSLFKELSCSKDTSYFLISKEIHRDGKLDGIFHCIVQKSEDKGELSIEAFEFNSPWKEAPSSHRMDLERPPQELDR